MPRRPGSASIAVFLAIACAALVCARAEAAILVDSWYTSLIDGKRVGYYHEIRETELEGGRRLVRTTQSGAYTIKRLGTEVVIESQATFLETFEGEPIRFEIRSKLAKSDYLTKAERKGDVFVVTQEALGKKTEIEIAASPDILFPNAMERAILKGGMTPGARLELKTFSPDAARPTRVVVANLGEEETTVADDRKATLVRTETEQDVLPGVKLVEWRDKKGVPVKTSLPILGLSIVSFLTTRERALVDPEGVELLAATLIKSNTTIPRPRSVERARFRLKLKDGDTTTLVPPSDTRQRLVSRDADGLLLEVRAETWRKLPNAVAPANAYLLASAVIQSDDRKLMELAARAAPEGGSREDTAKALNQWVSRSIEKKSLSIGLGTAAEVARDLAGDCTEHAVLLAGLARARGIPSKITMGLVYVDGVFGYHMWTEVFADGWKALDPTLGENAIDATHVKLAETALDQGFTDEALLGIVRLIASLELEVLDYDLDGQTYTSSLVLRGQIENGVYRNKAYGIRIEAPKKWTLMAASAEASAESELVRLKGPSGSTGLLFATPIAVDFRMDEWVIARYPGRKVAGTAPVVVSERAGKRYLLEGEDGREALLAVAHRGTLFTVHVALGALADSKAALDDLARAIKIE